MLHRKFINPNNSGSFVTFIRENYENLLTIGNFYIFKSEIFKDYEKGKNDIADILNGGQHLFSCFHDLYKDGDVVRRKSGGGNSAKEVQDVIYVFEYKSIL